MSRKSQIQIGETVAVLLVFFILIIIAFIFYARVIKSNAEVEADELSQLRSVGISQRVMFLPEIQCSQDVVEEISNCIDILKLKSAQDIMKENSVHYYDLLQFSEINVSEIYPESRKFGSIYSRKTEKFKDKFAMNVPISLYDPATGKYSFGVLTVESYLR